MTESTVRQPLDHWTYHAHRRGVPLDLPTDFIDEARDIVVGAIGRDWLEEMFKQCRRGFGFVAPPHQLIADFTIAGDPQIVEVIELAVYLKALARCRGLDLVLASLRVPGQFTTSLLQLAYAHRFGRIGGAVELEPSVPGGRRADIRVGIHGSDLVIECYVPDFTERSYLGEVLEYTAKRVFKTTRHLNIKTRLRLSFVRALDQSERLVLDRAARQVLFDVKKSGRAQQGLDFCLIEAEDISSTVIDPDWPRPDIEQPTSVPSEADGILAEIAIQAKDAESLRDGQTINKIRGSRILFRWPHVEPKSPESRVQQLVKRFDEKLAQTRVPDAGRVLIAQIDEAHSRRPEDEQLAAMLLEALSKTHDSISGVILAARVWNTASRYRYQGFMLHGPTDPNFQEISRALMSRESGDILQDYRAK